MGVGIRLSFEFVKYARRVVADIVVSAASSLSAVIAREMSYSAQQTSIMWDIAESAKKVKYIPTAWLADLKAAQMCHGLMIGEAQHVHHLKKAMVFKFEF